MSHASARVDAQYWPWPFGPMIRSKPPIPKLSSADTPPEKSKACLPVSTIALAGVITRMPRVCISMVASAFQYGWAPTFTPVTTMFTSPPRWVNSITRRSTAPIQSMFSVPLSIAILAPDDSVNHSTGTPIRSAKSSAAMIRLHSGSAKLPSPRVGSPNSATRVMPSGTCSVSLRRQSDHDVGGVHPVRSRHRNQGSLLVEVVLDELAGREAALPPRPAG